MKFSLKVSFLLSVLLFDCSQYSQFDAILRKRERKCLTLSCQIGHMSCFCWALNFSRERNLKNFEFLSWTQVEKCPDCVSEANAFSRKDFFNIALHVSSLYCQQQTMIQNFQALLLNHFRYMMNYKLQNGQRRGLWKRETGREQTNDSIDMKMITANDMKKIQTTWNFLNTDTKRMKERYVLWLIPCEINQMM